MLKRVHTVNIFAVCILVGNEGLVNNPCCLIIRLEDQLSTLLSMQI